MLYTCRTTLEKKTIKEHEIICLINVSIKYIFDATVIRNVWGGKIELIRERTKRCDARHKNKNKYYITDEHFFSVIIQTHT